MSKLLLCCVMLVLAVQAFAEETLFSGNWINDGFGGPVVKVTQLNNETTALMGGRGGWIINHKFLVGGGGYGTVSSVPVPMATIHDLPVEMHFGYGGFEFEYVESSADLVHYSLYCLIGAGTVEFTEDDGRKFNDSTDNRYSDKDEVFVLEPAVNGTMNVTSFFRISAGLSYRLVRGLDMSGIDNSDLSGPAAQVTLRFGSF